MEMSIEPQMLLLAFLFFLSIMADKAGYRFGVPTLLLFLIVGMLFGEDGLGFEYDDIESAQIVSVMALSVILFSGGMDTRINDVRPVVVQGVLLATVGVLLTAVLTGVVIWWIFGRVSLVETLTLPTALLLASTMASTDSASVFSILRSKGLNLKNNLRPLLELESGSNDPVAYIMTLTLIDIVKTSGTPNWWVVGGTVVMQLVIGLVMGYLLGKLVLLLISHMSLHNETLYPMLMLTVCMALYSLTCLAHGNGYLAVYIGGLVIGNDRFLHRRSVLRFFEGFSWLAQLLLFLTLGFLVTPHELLPIAIPAVLVSLVMIFVTRPMSVFACLHPFRWMDWRDKAFVSWVGLRGAVPITFAILAMAAEVPNARLIFNIVFFCTLVSLILQGSSLVSMARWLKVSETPVKATGSLAHFDIDLPDEIQSVATEVTITPEMLVRGKLMRDLALPANTLVIMVKRGNEFFVPSGKSALHPQDTLLMLTDEHPIREDIEQQMLQYQPSLHLTNYCREWLRSRINKHKEQDLSR